MEWLASSTHNSYDSGLKRFVEFCTQLGKLGPHGGARWMSGLSAFLSPLAQLVRPATIKVSLSAICALHIEQGFLDPLVDCLQLQRVAHGIKRSVGEAGSNHR